MFHAKFIINCSEQTKNMCMVLLCFNHNIYILTLVYTREGGSPPCLASSIRVRREEAALYPDPSRHCPSIASIGWESWPMAAAGCDTYREHFPAVHKATWSTCAPCKLCQVDTPSLAPSYNPSSRPYTLLPRSHTSSPLLHPLSCPDPAPSAPACSPADPSCIVNPLFLTHPRA